MQLTPLDSALMAEQKEVAAVVLKHGGVTIARIHNVAATRIQVLGEGFEWTQTLQACYRGYRIRKMFRERKKLFVKHEQLRAKKKEKKKEKRRNKERHKEEEEEEKSQGRRRRHKDRKNHKELPSPRSRIHQVN